MIDAGTSCPDIVVFDIGNVILDWEPLRLYRQFFASDQDARNFCETVCTLEWHVAHDRGIPMDENARPLIEQFPEHEHAIRAWKTRWLDMFHGYVEGVPDLIRQLQAQDVPIFGLSNIPDEVSDITFDAFPILRTFEDIVVSGAEGVVKPDPAIYRIALERMGQPKPSSVLFIDDSIRNIEAARELGFHTHHFNETPDLEKALVEYGLISLNLRR